MKIRIPNNRGKPCNSVSKTISWLILVTKCNPTDKTVEPRDLDIKKDIK